MSEETAGRIPVATAKAAVHRWTPLSIFFASSLAGIVVVLAFVPLVMSDYVMEQLTSLFILVILAVMWNALAGYGGLVSVGQQAFIGIGAYGTIFLAHVHGVKPFLAMLLAATHPERISHLILISAFARMTYADDYAWANPPEVREVLTKLIIDKWGTVEMQDHLRQFPDGPFEVIEHSKAGKL